MRYARLVVLAAPCLLLAACQQPSVGADTATSPQLNSGITSSNGGGQRAVGGLPSVSVGGSQGAVTTGAPNSKGTAQ